MSRLLHFRDVDNDVLVEMISRLQSHSEQDALSPMNSEVGVELVALHRCVETANGCTRCLESGKFCNK